jgi:hypothetical protein
MISALMSLSTSEPEATINNVDVDNLIKSALLDESGGGEDDRTFTNYIAVYPNAGEKGCDGDFPKLLLKLLFSAVAHDDADTLSTVLGDVRVQAIPKNNGSYGGHHYGGLRFGGPSYWDLDRENTLDDGETPNAVSLLQYAAEVNAFRCAEVILGMMVEKLDCGGVWGATSVHIACWHGHVETLKVLLKKRDSAATVGLQMNPGGAAADSGAVPTCILNARTCDVYGKFALY